MPFFPGPFFVLAPVPRSKCSSLHQGGWCRATKGRDYADQVVQCSFWTLFGKTLDSHYHLLRPNLITKAPHRIMWLSLVEGTRWPPQKHVKTLSCMWNCAFSFNWQKCIQRACKWWSIYISKRTEGRVWLDGLFLTIMLSTTVCRIYNVLFLLVY